jgi:hypothetical protein
MQKKNGMQDRLTESQHSKPPALATGGLLALAVAKLLLHVLTNHNYGIFIDELYYVACSEHLDFGYVDHPPMIALATWLARILLGDSLPALRLLPALAGAATVFLAGVVVRVLGGGRYAQLLAGLAVTVCPLYLFMNTILSMNAFDGLVWTLAAWLVALIIKRGKGIETDGYRALSVPRLWLLLGLVLGMGLQNKISVLFFGFGLAVGLLLTSERRHLRTPWPWCAGGIALGIFLPHIIWQVAHGWPTLEFIHNASVLKNRPMSVFEFLGAQILEIHPLNFVLLLFGLGFFFVSRAGRPYRLFGWMYLAFFTLLVTRNAKPYYAGPIYPLMLAGGAVAIEQLLERTRRVWPRAAVATILFVGGAALAPMTLPVLPVESFIQYQHRLLGGTLPSSEQKDVGPLPQHFADMFGNEELVALVAEVYRDLPAEERAKCVIFGMAYPQAGAIDFFGPRYDLPKAVSGHNSYWLWGPGEQGGETMIFAGLNQEELERMFEEVTLARVFHHPYVMPWRNDFPIYVCRRPHRPLKDLWPELKHFE